MVEIRPATLADVIHICETMWERGRTELTYLGIPPEEWLSQWKTRIKGSNAVAFGSHAILGCDWVNTGVCDTSFQASTSFESPKVGLAVTKAMRRAIPELMRERDVVESNTYSLCVVPEAEKWFRLLGLTEDTNFKGPRCGPFLLRRFFRSV